MIDTSVRALCGRIKIRILCRSWAQPLSSESSVPRFPVIQNPDNLLWFLGSCKKIYYNRRSPLGDVVIISIVTEPPGITTANIIITCRFQKVRFLVIMSEFFTIHPRRYITDAAMDHINESIPLLIFQQQKFFDVATHALILWHDAWEQEYWSQKIWSFLGNDWLNTFRVLGCQ